MKKYELRSISNILGLPLTGRNMDHAERILTFLINPVDEGRKLPGKKPAARKSKKRSTPSKESVDTDAETKEDKREVNCLFSPGKIILVLIRMDLITISNPVKHLQKNVRLTKQIPNPKKMKLNLRSTRQKHHQSIPWMKPFKYLSFAQPMLL